VGSNFAQDMNFVLSVHSSSPASGKSLDLEEPQY